MIKNIIINDKLYQLPLEQGKKGESTGVCYHLKTEIEDLAVKIYYRKNKKQPDVPEEWEIDIFSEVSKQVLPVVISKYPVYDEKGNYIGCAYPYIYENKGKTKEEIYKISREFLINELRLLEETVPVFSFNRIVLCDWGIHNLILGENENLPFGLYEIDDSFYHLTNLSTKMTLELNRDITSELIESFYEHYLEKENLSPRVIRKSIQKYRYTKDPILLLEKESRGYQSLGEYMKDYCKTMGKK